MPGGLGAWALLVVAVVIVLAMAFVYLLARDKTVAKTSFGVFIERERLEDHLAVASEQVTEPRWTPPEAP